MAASQSVASADRHAQGGHFCPACLKRVDAGAAQRREYCEDCRSGTVHLALLHCPTCGLVLAAEVEPGLRWSATGPTA